MHRLALGVVAGALTLSACSGSDDAGAPTTTVAAEPSATSTTAEVVGDGSTFCDAMVGIGKIGGGATPADVLAANAQLSALLDEAQAATPEDSPADLSALLDDYRAATEAIAAAGGDVEAAYAALPPEVAARISAPDSHPDAFAFLVERCGLTAP